MSLTDLPESSIIHTSFSDIANNRPVGKMGGGGVCGVRMHPPRSQKGPPDGIVKDLK